MTASGTAASAPSASSAPSAPTRVLLQARYDTRLLLANGEQVLLTVIIPIGVLLGLWWFPSLAPIPDGSDATAIDAALAGALAVAVLASAFASLAIATGFDRRSGSLLLLATTPLSRGELIWARAISTLTIVFAQAILLAVVAGALGWRPTPPALAAIAFLVLGTMSLAACAVLIAGLLRAEATLAFANAIFLLLLVAGGTAIPISSLPAWLGWFASSLPSGALAEGLRWSLVDPIGVPMVPIVILIAWAVVASLLARRTFRWD
jgi:ABC-2 type transport system permease protein